MIGFLTPSAYVLFVSVLLMAVAPCWAQPGCVTHSVVVAAMDNRLQAIELSSDNLRGLIGKEEIHIQSVKAEPPTRIVILLDNSGSMRDGSTVARLIADYILTHAPAPAPIALIVFGDSSQRFGFNYTTSDLRTVLFTLEQPKGHTALLDALKEATQLLGSPNASDVIYVITDGGENASRSKDKLVKAAVLNSGARIFAIVVPYNLFPAFSGFGPTTNEEREGLDKFSELLQLSGGAQLTLQSVHVDRKRKLTRIEPAISGFINTINNSYKVAFETAVPPAKPGKLKLAFVSANDKRLKNAALMYQSQMPACVPSPSK